MRIIEQFRENHPEGYEAYCWYSSALCALPYWQVGIWVNLDHWALGIDTEFDPGGSWDGSEERRFFSLHLGPASLVAVRVKRSKYAA